MTAASDLEGIVTGQPLALVLVPGLGLSLAWATGRQSIRTTAPTDVVQQIAGLDPRWVWWSAQETATPLVSAGVRLRTCWDLGAVGRLLHGLRRGDAGAVWAAQHGLAEPPVPRGEMDLFESQVQTGGPVGPDGQLSREWLRGTWSTDLSNAQQWADLVLQLQALQQQQVLELPDPRAAGRRPSLAFWTALSESIAALLSVELEVDGLPVNRQSAAELMTAIIGERPTSPQEEVAVRMARDAIVLDHFPGRTVDLRSPAQVRSLLVQVGVDLPDTRSWRLTPFGAAVPAVQALLKWRKAERIATTYGWSWLDNHVGADDRLRGSWGAADGAAGRMTAQAGLHNLPSEMRPAVLAEPGFTFVRADLGQVEPRVLAAVSGDPGLTQAAAGDDLYAPVARQLNCDRPTAKVAVLAAMYGQTSGAAGAALKDMDLAYPIAMAYLRSAEDAGRHGTAVRTYGGRLLRSASTGSGATAAEAANDDPTGTGFRRGRFVRNAVVQGAAAELFKAWAATVRHGLIPVKGTIVLCLHDELLLHVPESDAEQTGKLLAAALESTVRWWAAGSGVRFLAEVTTGPSWADTH
jgi:DNA polymerase-1